MISRVFALIAGTLILFACSRALIRALPGDPLETLVAESGTSLPVEALRAELGLDRPFFSALIQDLNRAAHGDFGVSLFSKKKIRPVLFEKFKKTLILTFCGLFFGVLLSLIIGLSAARRVGSAADRFCSFYGALTAALPTPWIGPFLLLLFAVWIPLLPAGGHVLLPAVTLAMTFSGFWSRLIRERVRETLATSAAPAARARGLSEPHVLLKYGLGPAAGGLLAYLGSQLGGLLAGAFVTETVFDWPGLGLYMVEAVLKRDYPVVEAAAFLTAAVSLTCIALGDAAQTYWDPRLRE